MSPLGIMKKLVNTLVKITLENIVEKIPIERVNAKPFIGPSPKRNKQKEAIRVVIFASKIVERDFSLIMIIGVAIGTYSSIFFAPYIMFLISKGKLTKNVE